MSSSLWVAKQRLRLLMKQRLSSMAHDAVLAQSHHVFDALKKFKPYQEASRISIFLSMPTSEIQTDAIVRDALSAGKEVFVPYLHRTPLQAENTPARVMDMVRLHDVGDYESLQRDRWGIPSIDPGTVHLRQRILGGPDVHHSDQASLDLILMPGVAFDTDPSNGSIRRLGHGKGFYDFFLERYLTKSEGKHLNEKRPLLLYGLAFKEQLLDGESEEERVPVGPLDKPIHGLVLGDGAIKRSEDNPIDQ